MTGAAKVSASVAKVPATNEPMAAVASAARRAGAGHLVAFERRHHRAASPGVLSRIEVVEPPYIAP